MINSSRLSNIKRNQKEAFILKEFSKLFLDMSLDNAEIRGLQVTRALLSQNKGSCELLFYDPEGQESFNKKLEILKLYGPSIRTSLAKILQFRYMPEIRFGFDVQFEKEKRINELLDSVKEDDFS